MSPGPHVRAGDCDCGAPPDASGPQPVSASVPNVPAVTDESTGPNATEGTDGRAASAGSSGPDAADAGDGAPFHHGPERSAHGGSDGPATDDARGAPTVIDGPRDDALVVYADYVCPFSYMLRFTLAEYWRSAERPPPVDWRPYDVHTRRRTTSDGDLQRWAVDDYYGSIAPVAREHAEELGLDLDLESNRYVDARLAHEAALFAYDWGGPVAMDGFHEAVYEAYWDRGLDVGDPDVLEAVGIDAGLDPDALRTALDERLYENARTAEYDRGSASGVTATPTMVYAGRSVEGLLDPDEIATFVG